MGLYDFEHLSTEIFPKKTSTGQKLSVLTVMSNNKNWVKDNAQWLYKEDPIANLFNRTVLKATPLREELYFIKCKCYKKDGSFNYFTFVVNEHTIFKRFRIYKSDDLSDFYLKGHTSLGEYMSYLNENKNKIVIKLFNNETSSLKEVLQNLIGTYQYVHYIDWDFRDGMVVEPINIQHFNKRTWIYLLTINNDDNMMFDYKSASSDAYYDNDFAKKYN